MSNIAYTAHLNDECTICLEKYSVEQSPIGLLACEHIFHLSCINEHLKTKSDCPLCRAEVKEKSIKVICVKSPKKSVWKGIKKAVIEVAIRVRDAFFHFLNFLFGTQLGKSSVAHRETTEENPPSSEEEPLALDLLLEDPVARAALEQQAAAYGIDDVNNLAPEVVRSFLSTLQPV